MYNQTTKTITTAPANATAYAWCGNTLTQQGAVTIGRNTDGNEVRILLHLAPPTLPENVLVQKAELVITQGASPQNGTPLIGLYAVRERSENGEFYAADHTLLDYDRTKSGVYASYAFDITKRLEEYQQDTTLPLDFVVELLEESTTADATLALFGQNSSFAPTLVITYDPAYFVAPAARTHTHDLGRFGQGSVDLVRGTLLWECEDFAWGGNRMPVTLKHRFNSAWAGKAYTAESAENALVADFSAMKVGHGFGLNVMQSITRILDPETLQLQSYRYVDENGSETVLSPDSDDATGHVYTDESDILHYHDDTRTLECGDERLLFDSNGRLTRITDGCGNTLAVNYEDGRITSVTDGAGRTFTFAYNTADALTAVTAPDGTAMQYAYTGDLLTAVTAPDGRTATVTYTADSRPAEIVLNDAAGAPFRRVVYTWSANGTVASVAEYGYENGAAVLSHTTAFTLAPAARRAVVTVTEAAAGDEEPTTLYTAYAFDTEGDVISEYTYTVGEDGRIQPYAGDMGGISRSVNWLKYHTFAIGADVGYVDLSVNDVWKPLKPAGSAALVKYYHALPAVPYNKGVLGVSTLSVEGSPSQIGAYQAVNALPQGDYTFSAYVYSQTTNEGKQACAYLRVVDGDGNLLAESEKITGSANEDWTRLAVPFTLSNVTNNGTNVQVQLLTDGNGVVYFNAPQLEDNACATAYNLLENGGFECDISEEWVGNGATALALDTAEPFLGTKALKLTNQFDTVCEAYQDVAVKRDASTRETFTLSGWAKGYGFPARERNTAAAPHFCLRAEVVYADPVLPTETFTADLSAATEGWQFAAVTFCKSRFAVVDHVRVSCDFGQNNGIAWFDGLQLVRDTLETKLTAEDFETEEELAVTAEASEDTTPAFEEAHDPYGNPLTETVFTEGEVGALYRTFGYRNGYTVAEWEGNDLVSESDTRGNVTAYAVDGVTSRNEQVTDRCGNQTAYTYDTAGHVTRVANTGADGAAYGTVDYTYDACDNLTAITRGDGMQYVLGYDPFRNLTSIGVHGAEHPLVQYAYKNGSGRLKEITYANGDKMTATYNGMGQLVAEKWYNAENTLTAHYKYVYDGVGNLVRSIDILAAKEYTYTYEEGALTRTAAYSVTVSENEIITARELLHSVRYVYDGEGTLVKKEFTAGGTTHVVTFTNEENRTTAQFAVGASEVCCQSETDHFGRKVSDALQLSESNTLTRAFAYYDGVLPQEHVDSGKTQSATTQLVSSITFSGGRTIAYEYDAEERITKVTDSVDGVTEYTYDALGQLLTERVNGTLVNRMTYDSYGNILTKNGVRYTYDTVWRDKLIAYGDDKFTYDAQGNPYVYRGHALAWEKGRQLKSFDNIQYTYNANGIRTSKTVGGVEHTYILDGTKILRETWGENVLVPLYDSEDSVCGIVYNDVPYYFQKNLQGDIIAITDSTGDIVARYTYDAWGVCTITQDEVGIGAINPYRYRGYYYDAEIGLYYVSSRYYDPEIGRWLNSDDPMYGCIPTNKCTHNVFQYCNNSPVVFADKNGNVASNIIGAVIGGVLGAIGGYVLTNWLANNLGLTGWKRNLFVWGLSALIGAAAAAIGYFVGPYVAKVWYALRAKLSGLVRGLFKSIQNITSSKMKHINVSKHLWNKVLGKQTSNVNIKNLIYRAIRNGEWQVLNNGTIGIHWKYAGQLIEITGNVVNGVFKVGNAWVWNGISKLLF